MTDQELDERVNVARRELEVIKASPQGTDHPLYIAALQGMRDACRAREAALFQFNYPKHRGRA